MNDAIKDIICGDAPVFILIAGPNGASKSTYSEKDLIPLGLTCIDPDKIAREMFGNPAQTRDEGIRATIEATDRVREYFRDARTVALESVFSDRKGHKLKLLEEARRYGFKTVLVFIGVDSPEICIARVMDRVVQGGHDVPDEMIRDRFPRCFENLKKALTNVDLALLIDNSGCYESEEPDSARHYQFCTVTAGKTVEIKKSVPSWFSRFHILNAIQNNGTL